MTPHHKAARKAANFLTAAYKEIEADSDGKRFNDHSAAYHRSPANKFYSIQKAARQQIDRATVLVSAVLFEYPREPIARNLIEVVLAAKDEQLSLAAANGHFRERLSKLIGDLSKMAEWECLIEVTNVTIEGNCIDIGSCQIRQFTNELHALWRARFRTGHYRPSPEILAAAGFWPPSQHDDSRLVGRTVAVVTVEAADIHHAQARTKQIVDESLNLLRFMQLQLIGFEREAAKLGSGNDDPSAHVLSIQKDQFGSMVKSLSISGGGFPVAAMTTVPAWQPLNLILREPREHRTALQARIATALDWISQATLAVSTAVQIVSLITAWEALFILRGESNGKRSKLCGRIPWIVSTDVTERSAAAANIDRLYRQRSTCLHSGESFVDPETLELARQMVCDSVSKLVTDQRFSVFRTLEDLLDWIDQEEQSIAATTAAVANS